MNWKTIESAPKGGTKVFGRLKDSDIPHTVHWKVRYGWVISWDGYILSDADGPTHWAPINDEVPPLTWTSDKPTVPGVYVVMEMDDPEDPPWLLRLLPDGSIEHTGYNNDCWTKLANSIRPDDWNCLFLGPLPPTQEGGEG